MRPWDVFAPSEEFVRGLQIVSLAICIGLALSLVIHQVVRRRRQPDRRVENAITEFLRDRSRLNFTEGELQAAVRERLGGAVPLDRLYEALAVLLRRGSIVASEDAFLTERGTVRFRRFGIAYTARAPVGKLWPV